MPDLRPAPVYIREVTLSTGETGVRVTLGMAQRLYYPDLPHCKVCDESASDVPLFRCDHVTVIRRHRGRHDGQTSLTTHHRCLATICAAHVVHSAEGEDLCPAHTQG